jgi:hypothetical protein
MELLRKALDCGQAQEIEFPVTKSNLVRLLSEEIQSQKAIKTVEEAEIELLEVKVSVAGRILSWVFH